MRRAVGILVGASAGLIALAAEAQPAIEVEFFDRWARERYEAGVPLDALPLFLRAHQIAPSPRSLFNIAVVADVAKERRLAHSFFEAYLASRPDDPALVARARARLSVLAKRLARIEVRSEPSGAKIFVGRRMLGSYGQTPRRVALRPGRYTLTLALDGYREAKAEVTAMQGKLAHVEVALVPLTGTLIVQTTPAGGVVQVVGTDRMLSDGSSTELSVGTYRLRYAPPRHPVAEAQVRIEAGQTERRRLVASSAGAAALGTLLVNADQQPADVWVDGLRRAETPARLELQAGPHSIEVRGPAGRWVGTVDIRAGEAELLNARLRPIAQER